MQMAQVQSLGWEDPLEKGTVTRSSILAWRIPRTEEPGGLQPMGSQAVGHFYLSVTFLVTPPWTSYLKSKVPSQHSQSLLHCSTFLNIPCHHLTHHAIYLLSVANWLYSLTRHQFHKDKNSAFLLTCVSSGLQNSVCYLVGSQQIFVLWINCF